MGEHIGYNLSFRLAQAIVAESDDFHRTHRAGIACQIIRDAIEQQRFSLPRRELNWLKRIENHLAEYSTEAQILEYGMANYNEVFVPQEYGLE